MKSNSQP